jgi:hypothetical protein
MIEDKIFKDFEDFCYWYKNLSLKNVEEEFDKKEAIIIYFDLENYDTGAI